ncbi:MAG: hypothetical protein HRT67_07275 [Flavobacteriaceae bacterium]|nr:hypothetical protein [Flavobacteriaceae bacterium]
MRIKPFKAQILFTIFSLVFAAVNAQNVGSIQRGQRGYTPPPTTSTTAYVELKDVQEEVNRRLPICVSEFNLDDFEKEILKGLLTKKFESENAVLEDKKVNRDERRKRFIQIDKDFSTELALIMSAEEIERFKGLDFSKIEKDDKKKKKRKRRKS